MRKYKLRSTRNAHASPVNANTREEIDGGGGDRTGKVDSRINVVNIPKEIHEHTNHRLTQTHVVIKLSPTQLDLLLLQLRALQICGRRIHRLAILPLLPDLIEIIVSRWRRFGLIEWRIVRIGVRAVMEDGAVGVLVDACQGLDMCFPCDRPPRPTPWSFTSPVCARIWHRTMPVGEHHDFEVRR